MTTLPRANGSSYDVFLSFRGEDTRHSFTDHLYTALEHAGIKTFRDSNDAERGEELKQEIEGAIKASDASIIVLSKKYATSTWCLDELSLILERRMDYNHFVLPLFYKVDPSDVRKQKGRFFIQADSLSRRWTEDNVNRWKAALTEVADLIGERVIGSEADFLKKIVDSIYNRLHRKKIYLPPNLIGMDAREKEINSWINQSESKFLVIYGMAGSGKSTLAQYIVHSNIQSFETVSIVQNIGQKCKGPHDMVKLQEQLCTDMLRGKDTRIPTVCQGTPTIEVLLERKKALIVLDDIVKESQLEDLLGSGIVNKESKIIVTTDNDLSNWFKLKSRRYEEYKMKLLNDKDSLELLSLNAFRSKTPVDGFKELAKRVVEYCEGSPLALKLLGSSLSKDNSIRSWESALRLFGKDFHEEIYDALKRSFDSLPYDSDKELFLHIACFFVGKDMDYIVKILEPEYSAESEIKTLIKRCFLYITPDKKLMMHRLLQDMGRSLVDRESVGLAVHSRIRHVGLTERSRIWRNKDSYDMLRRGKSSNLLKGLTLDMRLLMKEDEFNSKQIKESPLTTYSLQRMDQLELLQLNYVKLTGSYKDSSHRLLWLCWFGYNKSIIDSDILMGNMVALDLTYSCLKEFEPPTVLQSLKILNFKDSRSLLEIRNIHLIPNLETLILWNCHCLLRVCKTIGNLEKLALLNMTGCKNLYNKEQLSSLVKLKASTYGGESTQELSFPLPHSLERLFLNNCKLECTDYFPLSFSDQSSLQYLNLCNSLFEELPCYIHLKNLRVLDLSFCSRLKNLLRLPSTLSELYVYYCNSIEKITFDSGRFTLQEFGYEGCINLSEIEGFLKLVLIAILDETDLGHMMWLKEYENHVVCLVGDDGLTKYRSCRLQMLYEFNIMSTSLPDIKHPSLTPEYASQYTCLSFNVPPCPRSRSLKGLNVTVRYRISGDDWAWFCKMSKTGDSDLIYSPKVFGKPASGEVGIWLSYWPIGNSLEVGDEVTVSIVVKRGLEVLECGARLVYTDDDVTGEILENKIGWVETLGGDLSGFQLITGAYYLCRHDFFEQMEVGRLAPGWFSSLVGDHIDSTEVRGWRMTGRPRQLYQSFTELKTVRCIMYEPETTEGIYKIAELTKSSIVDKTMESTSELSEAIPMDTDINDETGYSDQEYDDLGWYQNDVDKDDVDVDVDDVDADYVDINDKTGFSDSESDDFSWIKESEETKGSPTRPFDLKSESTDTESDYKSESTDTEFDLSRLSLQETMNTNFDSELNFSASNMFNSKVELSNFLGSIDILPDAYHAILKTTLPYKLHRNPSGIPILAFNISPDYTKRFLNGEFDLVSSENHSLVDFISTKVNPSFFINKAAIDLYEHFIHDLSKLEDQLMNKPLIITGQSLGGYLAILFTLRLHYIQESSDYRKNKRPICITFGSPLLGDEALQRAIHERWAWKSSLLNVVTKTDPLACFFTSNTIYKPFGTFMCCTESGGHTAFEDQEAILAVLDIMAALNAENNEMQDYEDNLRSIRRKVLYRGAVESGEPHLNSLRAGIILQFKEVGVFDDILNDLILRMEKKQVRMIRSHKITYMYEPTNKLNEMKISLTFMEWYMKTTRSKGGYYDSYKNRKTTTRSEIELHQKILMYKAFLDQYWRQFVGEKEQMPLQEGAKLRKRWLYSANNYRMIVEPLEIADHYRIGYTNYIQTRQYHYNLIEKWYNEDTVSYRRERASSLTVDSCFWAHVEEAFIAIRDLRKEGSRNNADDIVKRLEHFETYLMNGINNFEVSPDIFSDGSSLMEWWKEYKEYKGSSYDSEFARYMNSEAYRSYQ